MSDETYQGGAEVAVRQAPARTVDLRDRATDSWTDVVAEASKLGTMIANTEFVPKGLRGDGAKVTAAILFSRELGLPPMTGLGSTHVIEGKAGISAEMMRALVLQAGHELAVKKMDRTTCEIWGRRKGAEEWTKATWTIQEAQQTKVFISKEKGWQPLSTKSNWQSWPAEMLLARCTTRLIRMIFPDVAHGMRTVEELEDMSEVVDGEVVEAPAPAAPVQRKRKERPAPAETPAPVEAEVVDDGDTSDAAAPDASKTVQRRRMSRPAPRPTPAAQEKTEPAKPADDIVDAEVDTLPEEPTETGTLVDAEVVEEADPTSPATPTEVTDISDKRRKAGTIVAIKHFERLDVKDRAERLWLMSEFTGRKIGSTNDLTDQELHALNHILERAKDMAVFQKMLDQKRAEREPSK